MRIHSHLGVPVLIQHLIKRPSGHPLRLTTRIPPSSYIEIYEYPGDLSRDYAFTDIGGSVFLGGLRLPATSGEPTWTLQGHSRGALGGGLLISLEGEDYTLWPWAGPGGSRR